MIVNYVQNNKCVFKSSISAKKYIEILYICKYCTYCKYIEIGVAVQGWL